MPDAGSPRAETAVSAWWLGSSGKYTGVVCTTVWWEASKAIKRAVAQSSHLRIVSSLRVGRAGIVSC